MPSTIHQEPYIDYLTFSHFSSAFFNLYKGKIVLSRKPWKRNTVKKQMLNNFQFYQNSPSLKTILIVLKF